MSVSKENKIIGENEINLFLECINLTEKLLNRCIQENKEKQVKGLQKLLNDMYNDYYKGLQELNYIKIKGNLINELIKK